jgi:hypothetical protein
MDRACRGSDRGALCDLGWCGGKEGLSRMRWADEHVLSDRGLTYKETP